MKTKYKVMISAGAIILLTAASVFSIAADKLPQYRKIIVTQTNRVTIGQTLNLEGYIEPFAKQEIILDRNQKVAEVYVDRWQRVKSGDILFRLDDSDTAYKLKSENLNLKALQSELNNLLKSENKDKKDLSFAVAQAEVQYKNAAEDLEDAKLKYEQNKELFQGGFLSKEELEASAKSLQKLEGQTALSELQLEKAKDNLNDYGDQRQQQIDKLKSNIELINMEIESLNSKIDISSKALIDGWVAKIDIKDGQYPSEDNAKIEIFDISKYVINLYIKQNEAVQIKNGRKASITITGLEEKSYTGTVIDIDDTAALQPGGSKTPMVKIKVAFDEVDENVKVGFEAKVKLDLNIRTDVTAVNFQGIVEDNNGNKFVYLFKDNKAERKLVKTGVEDGFMVEIIEGLIPGDQYILNPPERVQSETSFKLWSWGYELK
jgi:multidrug efflux pump subunit AcrA (membrane-fusion protein)